MNLLKSVMKTRQITLPVKTSNGTWKLLTFLGETHIKFNDEKEYVKKIINSFESEIGYKIATEGINYNPWWGRLFTFYNSSIFDVKNAIWLEDGYKMSFLEKFSLECFPIALVLCLINAFNPRFFNTKLKLAMFGFVFFINYHLFFNGRDNYMAKQVLDILEDENIEHLLVITGMGHTHSIIYILIKQLKKIS